MSLLNPSQKFLGTATTDETALFGNAPDFLSEAQSKDFYTSSLLYSMETDADVKLAPHGKIAQRKISVE